MMIAMPSKRATIDPDDLLALARDEMAQAVGFENDDELIGVRERALEYFKGEMNDLKVLPNRSKAVSTDFADAVETVMPDLMEIFTGGEDVATFRPVGEEDVEAAAQETDYVNHVIFNENDGWRCLHTLIKDALTVKLGIVKVWGEQTEEHCEQRLLSQTAESMAVAQEGGAELVDVEATDPDPQTGEALFNCTAITIKRAGRTRIMAVPPEDFAFARDTTSIRDTTYCAMRSRPRAQDLIADGYDRDLVESLSAYGFADQNGIEQARDVGGEHDTGTQLVNSPLNLHQVEIIEHYIRVDADGDGYPELYRLVTDASASINLKHERADLIPFSVSTPYLVSHRLIGQSLFDKLCEVQRIRTLLLRMWLDSGNFALNQRYEVGEDASGAHTLDDLLNNAPGSPVRSKTGAAVRAIGGGRLDFDVANAMEFMATVGEQRSGIVRNAQGLNPDTLHDTAKGAAALMTAAQKRVRLIARVFAETGIKDLCLLVHAITRATVPAGAKAKLRGKWVTVDPTQWGARDDMTIEIGVGSGGREAETAALSMVAGAQKQLVELQGGAEGPFVKPENIYNLAKRMCTVAGLKTADLYFSDPAETPPEAAGPPQPPPPDPQLVKVNGELELERYKIDEANKLKREQMAGEFALRKHQLNMEARLRLIDDAEGGSGPPIQFGGDI